MENEENYLFIVLLNQFLNKEIFTCKGTKAVTGHVTGCVCSYLSFIICMLTSLWPHWPLNRTLPEWNTGNRLSWTLSFSPADEMNDRVKHTNKTFLHFDQQGFSLKTFEHLSINVFTPEPHKRPCSRDITVNVIVLKQVKKAFQRLSSVLFPVCEKIEQRKFEVI